MVVQKAQVYAEDMTDEAMNEALRVGEDALKEFSSDPAEKQFTTIAKFIRSHFDKRHGRGWNVVVGRSFGAFVTHEIKTYCYFAVGGLNVLLWRA